MLIEFNFKNEIDDLEIEECVKLINNGKVSIIPTDTVYGIGADATNSCAVRKIYEIKQRDFSNPINVLVSSKEMFEKVVKKSNKIAEILIKEFWPGALTIVMEKSEYIPDIVTSGNNTIGVRMPENEIVLKIIEKLGRPIAAPSANISGKLSGTDVESIREDLKDKVDVIIDGGESKVGIESTIVRVNEKSVTILRNGAISKEQIESLGIIVENEEVKDERKHYKINCETILAYDEDEDEKFIKIGRCIRENKEKEISVVYFKEDAEFLKIIYGSLLKEFYIEVRFFEIGSKNDLKGVLKNIYPTLREIEKVGTKVCILEGIKKEGLATSIMEIFEKVCK